MSGDKYRGFGEGRGSLVFYDTIVLHGHPRWNEDDMRGGGDNCEIYVI
jgi:hypothetical protein